MHLQDGGKLQTPELAPVPWRLTVRTDTHHYNLKNDNFCVAYTKCIAALCYDLIYLFIYLFVYESRAPVT